MRLVWQTDSDRLMTGGAFSKSKVHFFFQLMRINLICVHIIHTVKTLVNTYKRCRNCALNPVSQKPIINSWVLHFWFFWICHKNNNAVHNTNETSSPRSHFGLSLHISGIFSEVKLWCDVKNATLTRELIKVYWVRATSADPQGYRPRGSQLCRYIHNITQVEEGVEFLWHPFCSQKLQRCFN